MKTVAKILFVISTVGFTWLLYDSRGTPETNGVPVAQERPADWQGAEAVRRGLL